MDYRILGPLEVSDNGRQVGLGGDKQRALLAILLLHANEVVSSDRLMDDLWGEAPPASALRTLQAYVSRLRRALGVMASVSVAGERDPAGGSGNGALLTRGRGYVLRVVPGELDRHRFGDLVEQGRQALAAGDPARAAELLRDALSLWRGPPLADFTYEPFAQAPIAQLEELRLGALEDRVEADLALGMDRQLVGELGELVERHPLRERLRGQLMLALYRSGRPAEALEVYQEFRRALSEQLGLDPGLGLQQLELAILSRDPSLDGRSGNGASDFLVPPPPQRKRIDRRRRRLAVAALALVGLALAGLVAASSFGGDAPQSVIAVDSVGAISPSSGAVLAVVPVGSSPVAVAAGDRAVWASNYNGGTVSRIDRTTHDVQMIPAGSTPSGIAVGFGAVWLANNLAGTVSRIDPGVDRVVESIPVGNGPSGVAVGEGAVWVTNSSDGSLSRIDPVSDSVNKTIALGGGATDVSVGFGSVWVSDEADGRVVRVDPQSGELIATINVGTGASSIAVGDGAVWVTNSLDGTVSRIDPQNNHVIAVITVGDGPSAIAVGSGGVWVANEFGRTVVRINPATDTVAQTVAVGNSPRGLAVAGGLVWVGAQDSGASHRGGTLTALQSLPFGSFDPEKDVTTLSLAPVLTLYITNDGLTAFKRVGGSDGAQLVPDLATTIPAPTDGGRVYTFTLRRGIRYSNGQPVRPEDFRRAIERSFTVGRSPYYEEIVGGAGCVAHPLRCDLRRGIVTDDASATVAFHLVAPDPEFPYRLAVFTAFAVPPRTPNHDIGTHPLPATGPYEIASITPRRVTLVRNPYFHEWSHAAQPDGYPDRIVWRTGASPQTEVTAVQHGYADYTPDLSELPARSLHEVQINYPSLLQENLADETLLLGLNTRAAPFNDLRVRRALNYAVDRAKLAQLLGQDSRPTCQTLPPYVPGFHRYCPYTLDANVAGVWSAPDLAKARALIAASGTRGTPITIWIPPASAFGDFTPAGRYLVSLLHQLGYPAHARDNASPNQLADSRTKAQAFLAVFAANYPAASEFLGPQQQSCQSFTPDSTSNTNWYEFCDPQFDATVSRALTAEAAGLPATTLWAKADQQLTNQAPLVALATPRVTDLVSHRIGDYQYNPQLSVLIDQLWVR